MERPDFQCSTVSFSLASLSLGSLSSLDMVSTSITRKVREVAGPYTLEGQSSGQPGCSLKRERAGQVVGCPEEEIIQIMDKIWDTHA